MRRTCRMLRIVAMGLSSRCRRTSALIAVLVLCTSFAVTATAAPGAIARSDSPAIRPSVEFSTVDCATAASCELIGVESPDGAAATPTVNAHRIQQRAIIENGSRSVGCQSASRGPGDVKGASPLCSRELAPPRDFPRFSPRSTSGCPWCARRNAARRSPW
jgi:hypothetical protein